MGQYIEINGEFRAKSKVIKLAKQNPRFVVDNDTSEFDSGMWFRYALHYINTPHIKLTDFSKLDGGHWVVLIKLDSRFINMCNWTALEIRHWDHLIQYYDHLKHHPMYKLAML